jgi:nitrate reductase assembly molybdenum cofactor insertion protein NarJ
MNAVDIDKLTKVFKLVCPDPFLIASRISSYPLETVRKDLNELLENDDIDLFCQVSSSEDFWKMLKLAIKDNFKTPKSINELASRHIEIFDRNSHKNSLYETGYGINRSQIKTTELSDISGFYNAFGFKLTENGMQREMLDHVGVECEFYAILLAKQAYLVDTNELEGAEIVLDARKKFLQDHLGRFVSSIAKQPGVKDDKFYSLVFSWIAALVSDECTRLDVGVVPSDYLSDELEEELSCEIATNIIPQIGSVGRIK